MTPALSIDGRLVASGKGLPPAEILPLPGGAPAEPSCGCGKSCDARRLAFQRKQSDNRDRSYFAEALD